MEDKKARRGESNMNVTNYRKEHQEKIKKIAQQMLEVCQANDCTIFDVRVAVDKLMKTIENTKV